ncbi:DUF4148 domain-containing protein [Caballeronia sp. LZ043]|uniref:DUF4148 domain-containing protein n=1 Tax=Caballeronia sp. LZ043 TaxID=3038569 RepID=UPI00285C4F32|nr:DUF4148 domain-containing protein [Caballeronia sp. LZ043]MDR5826214.1 DUF4148 domain-containing protein [Caballeronia sp. LZ043]
MKSLVHTIVASLCLASPLAGFAQESHGLTRAQVRAEIAELREFGYNGSLGENPNYPADIQAAEAKRSQHYAKTGVGGATGSTSETGRSGVSRNDWDAMYSHP